MSNYVRLKAAAIAAIVLLSGTLGLYPPIASSLGWSIPEWLASHRIALGLDLRGGVHLVLGVGFPPAMTPAEREATLTQTLEIIERRVNELGVAEAIVTTQGSNRDQILVQLPGVTDVESAQRTLQSTGVLRLQLVERGSAPSVDALLRGEPVPADTDLVFGDPQAQGQDAAYLVRRDLAVGGDQIRTARAILDENNRPAVVFSMRAAGATQLAALTGDHIGRALAVVVDGRVRSVAQIDDRISTDGRIQGSFTMDDAQRLAILLRSGALTVPLTYLSQQTIGASLGEDAVRAGIRASTVAVVAVVVLLLGFYRGSGLNAVAALVCNLTLLAGLMAAAGVVLTLPGIAGLVLTIGIGVDSNILVFERIKEELSTGAGPGRAVDEAFRHVFRTLFDTHVAAIIGAAFLYQMGTSAIRGFAVTLTLGLVSNLFTSTFVSRTIFDARDPERRLSI